MNALTHLLSPAAGRILEAIQRLQAATHEAWTIDWERHALTCPHGAVVPVADVLDGSPAVLWDRAALAHRLADRRAA